MNIHIDREGIKTIKLTKTETLLLRRAKVLQDAVLQACDDDGEDASSVIQLAIAKDMAPAKEPEPQKATT